MNGDGQQLTVAHKAAWALLILVVAGLMGYSFWKKAHPPVPDLSGRGMTSTGDAPKPEDLAVWGRVKSFSLTDQHGKRVEAKDLLGEVWVADFVFTRCAGTCPLITRQVALLDKELADLPSVKLVSFSMDPEYDTPEVLSKYAVKEDAVSPRWMFLTGDKSEIYRITSDEFKLAVREENKVQNEPILHSKMLVLVDAQGYIRGYFSALGFEGPNAETVKLLAASVRKLRTLPAVDPSTLKGVTK